MESAFSRMPINQSLALPKKAIEAYRQSLAGFERLGLANERAVSFAFQTLLDDCARQKGYKLVPEYPLHRRGQSPLRADGAIVDEFNLAHGLWEAKDTADDLEKEIKAKFALGYPQRNILFQSSDRAILYQNSRRVLDTPLTLDGQIADTLRAFLDYQEPAQEEWEAASAEFKDRIAEHGRALAEIIRKEASENAKFAAAFANFVTLCRASLNPSLSEAAVEEMLVQHILTERIFRTIFQAGDFMSRNVIAVEIEEVVRSLTSRSFSRDGFLKTLDRFYIATERAAALNTDFSEKQKFLNTVYERFFQGFAVKQADTLGIVYTPQPIVDFMVASVERLLERDFGKSLGHKQVHILDGFTGTGNFVVNIMQEIPRPALPHKYAQELHCNEVLLLPYYVACMNIEHAYWEAIGEYESFNGICLVDTFETAEHSQHELSFMSEANSKRVLEQKKLGIFVCIGNPPYNAWQVNENDNNRNRKYTVIDRRVRETYGDASAAQNRNSLSDPYVKAIRWASDRIIANGEGVVAFVTNSAFLDSIACDGLRRHLAEDFDEIRVVDLGGNVRKNPKLSGTTHNVFGIQVGVSINFFVRLPRKEASGKRQAKIFYHAAPKDARRTEKLRWLEETGDIDKVSWQELTPDKRYNWIQSGLLEDFENFLPLGDRRASGTNAAAPPIFRHYSGGVKTSRDPWAVNFSRETLAVNMERTIETYNSQVEAWHRAKKKPNNVEDFIEYDSARISWSRDLKKDLLRHRLVEFDQSKIRRYLYRPFTKSWLYFDRIMNEEVYGFPEIFPTPASEKENVLIWVKAGGDWPMFALVSNSICDLLPQGGSQCFPLYKYDEDGTNRQENITLSALLRFQSHYGDDKITRLDIFHYVYALLHHPGYRERYAGNLKRELARIPFAPEFHTFARAGRRLADLHLGYEQAEEYAGLRRIDNRNVPLNWRVDPRMRLSSNKRTIFYNDSLTLEGIPPEAFDYKLGNRSALEWVIDQYQAGMDKQSGLRNDPNRPEDAQYILRLVGQVITVSLETLKIVAGLPENFGAEEDSTIQETREWRQNQPLMNSENAQRLAREQRESIQKNVRARRGSGATPSVKS